MRKQEELSNPASCLNRAREDELLFVLLGRDRAAPVAIRAWVNERIRLGKNKPDDGQILDALDWIKTVEEEWSTTDGDNSPEREIERLQALVQSLSDRVAAQSELLSRQAEKEPPA